MPEGHLQAPPPTTLQPGTRVNRYEVRELIGVGGMGEVYRAYDAVLTRDVALKVLRIDRPLDSARLEEMAREARAAGALNHPNILATYDAGTFRGAPYVVFELLQGQSLRERLASRNVTLQRALDWAIQVAHALGAAHAKRIVHLDLKPENVFITEDDVVKLLDFGLAQLFEPDAVTDPGDTDQDTATESLDLRCIRGTPSYMSPEQVHGRAVDHRADIFSLGAVLYEMVSGRRAFSGPTPPAVMAAVVGREPAALMEVPPSLRRILERCLEKNPARRFQSAQDLALALGVAAEGRPERLSRRLGSRYRWAIAGVVVVALVWAALTLLRQRVVPAQVAASRPEAVPLTSSPGRELQPALSRDGQRVAYVWDGPTGNNFDLYTKVIGAETGLRLTDHPASDCCPAWSPDGRWIAFIRTEGAGGWLLMVPSSGGPERKLRPVSPWFGSGVSFSPDGRWIALSEPPASRAPHGVVLHGVDSRQAKVLTRPGAAFAGDAFPAFSPDGRSLAFARLPAHGDTFEWALLSLVPAEGGELQTVAREGRVVGGLEWTRDGRGLLFAADRGDDRPRLWRLLLGEGGSVRPVGEELPLSNATGAETLGEVSRPYRISAAFDADRLAYAQNRYDTDVWQLDLGTAGPSVPRRLLTSTQLDESPQFSPDGRRIAFSSTRASRKSQIWTCGADGQGCVQLTSFTAACGTPRWSPDGTRLAFDSAAEGQAEIYVIDVDTGGWQRLTSDAASDVVPSWSRDGASIYFASDRGGAFQVWKLPSQGGKPTAITREGGFAAFESVDGRTVYYTQEARPGLWSVPVGGSRERKLLDVPACWGYWALGPQGVFVLDAGGASGPRIKLLPAGGTVLQDLASAPGAPACGESGLALSPDGRVLLYVAASRESDVVLIDGFR